MHKYVDSSASATKNRQTGRDNRALPESEKGNITALLGDKIVAGEASVVKLVGVGGGGTPQRHFKELY